VLYETDKQAPPLPSASSLASSNWRSRNASLSTSMHCGQVTPRIRSFAFMVMRWLKAQRSWSLSCTRTKEGSPLRVRRCPTATDLYISHRRKKYGLTAEWQRSSVLADGSLSVGNRSALLSGIRDQCLGDRFDFIASRRVQVAGSA
jgi:hypothetical protein